jgi:hypothetical protein
VIGFTMPQGWQPTMVRMKRAIAFAAALMILAPLARADRGVQVIHGVYEARISGYCRNITEKDTLSGPAGDFRVQRGGGLAANGNRHVIFVDDGGVVSVTGQSSIIFVSRGGQATIGGQKNQVFMESGSRVVILGQAMIATVGELELKVNRNAEECR